MTLEPALADLFSLAKKRVESTLEGILPAVAKEPSRLHTAMRYAALGEGKRVRPLLVYATAQAVYSDHASADSAAAAVELIHAYSLVHDDLPAMDDDDLRRGRATVHKAFDEGTAVLVGDALQTLAFDVLINDPHIADSTKLEMLKWLSRASGVAGMVGGQALDIQSVDTQLDLEHLERMHNLKTGALIEASVALGALSNPKLSSDDFDRLINYAKCIGLAFQVKDDLLDIEANSETLGKTQGKDAAANKPTYPALLGLEGARDKANTLLEQALEALENFGDSADPLRDLAKYIVQRDH
jgi:farnesyl diphosphate synthase